MASIQDFVNSVKDAATHAPSAITNFAENNPVSKFLLGPAINTAHDIGAGLGYNGNDQTFAELQKQQEDAFRRAALETNPAKKQMWNQVGQRAYDQIHQLSGQVQNSFSPDVGENPLMRGLKTGIAVGGTADIAAHPIKTVQGALSLAKGGLTAIAHPIQSLQGGIDALENVPHAIQQLPEIAKTALANPDNFNLVNGSNSVASPLIANRVLNKVVPAPVEAGAGGLETRVVSGQTILPEIGPKKSVTQIVLKPSVYGAGKESAVQDTINRYVPGNTATEQYANLEPTMAKFGDQIQKVMSSEPKTASLDTLMEDYDKNLQNEGVYRTAQGTKTAVKSQAEKYVAKLFNLATDETGQPAPGVISDQSLYDVRQSITQDAKSVYRKIENGTSLTDKDRVILAAGQSVDDTLSNLHPQVTDLITKQSHLYQAADPLFDARKLEIADTAKAAAVDRADKTPQWLKNIKTTMSEHPIVSAGAAGAIGALGLNEFRDLPNQVGSAVGLGKLALDKVEHVFDNKNTAQAAQNQGGQLQNNPNMDVHGNPTISQPGVTSQTGHYSIGNNTDNGILLQNDWKNQRNTLTQQIAQADASGNGVLSKQLQGQRDALDTTYSSQSELRNTYATYASTAGLANSAYNLIQSAPIGLLNLNGSYDKLLNATDPKYAALGRALQAIQQETGIDLSSAKSKESLLASLDYALSTEQNKFNTQKILYYGGNTLNPSAPTTTTLPPTPPAFPTGGQINGVNHVNFDFNKVNGGLSQ